VGVECEFAAGVREGDQFVFDQPVDRALGVDAFLVALAGRNAGEELDAFVDGCDREDVELAFLDGGDDIAAQHEMLLVGPGDHHGVGAVEAAGAAEFEEAFDLVVDAADSLDFAALIDGAGDGKVLADRHVGEGREQGIELGRRSAVAVDAAVGLFEDDAGRQRRRAVEGVAAGEEGREDQHAFGMQRAAEFDFALDVVDLAGAHAHARSDAAGLAEGEAAKRHDAEAVDLADLAACGVDQHDVAFDHFARADADALVPSHVGGHRAVDVGGVDKFVSGFGGPEIGFAQAVGKGSDAQRQFRRVLGFAPEFFDDVGYGLGGERAQVFTFRDRADQPGVVGNGLIAPIDRVLEVDGDFEQFGKVGVALEQRMIELAVAEQDDLGRERDGIGLQGLRAHDRHAVHGRFNRHGAGAQATFQHLPRIGLKQQSACVDQQISAVGQMQAAGADEREIGEQGAHLRLLFDAADEIANRRVVFDDNGGSGFGAIADQQVNPEAAQARIGLGGEIGHRHVGHNFFPFGDRGDAKQTGVADQFLCYRFDVCKHVRQIGEGAANVFDHVHDRQVGVFAVEFRHFLAAFAFPAGKAFEQNGKFILQRFELAGYHFALGIGQGIEVFWLHDTRLYNGSEGESDGRAQQGEVLGAGLFAQGLEGLLLGMVDAVDGGAAARLVFVAFEDGWDERLQFVDGLVHRVFELLGPAGWQCDGARTVGLREIGHVNPISGGGHFRGILVDQREDGAVAGGAAFAQNKDVEARLVDAGAEVQGLKGAGLADQSFEGFQFGGGFEGERFGFTDPAKARRH